MDCSSSLDTSIFIVSLHLIYNKSDQPTPLARLSSMFYLIRRTLRLACLENCRFPNISSHSKVLFRCSSGTICLSIIFHTRPSLASNTQVVVEPDGSIQFVRSSLMIDLYRYQLEALGLATPYEPHEVSVPARLDFHSVELPTLRHPTIRRTYLSALVFRFRLVSCL
jgi:hypothetical protein